MEKYLILIFVSLIIFYRRNQYHNLYIYMFIYLLKKLLLFLLLIFDKFTKHINL
jgi:hypothetical protein